MSDVDCRRCLEVLGDFLDQQLPGPVQEDVQTHLAGCAACHAELERQRRRDEVLAEGLDALASRAPPLEGLLEGIRGRLGSPGAADGTERPEEVGATRPGHRLDPFAPVPRWMRRLPTLKPATGVVFDGKLESTCHVLSALAALIKAGRPVAGAINLLAAREGGARSASWTALRTTVNSGVLLSEALRDHPELFPAYLCEAIAAGEESGRLGEVLEELATVLRDRNDASQKIAGNLSYPFMVLGLVCGLATFITTMVMPKFVMIYARHGVDLPFASQVLLTICGAHRQIQTAVLVIVGLIAIVGYLVLVRRWFTDQVDALKLCLPVYRQIHGQELLGWYCSLVSVLIRGGVPVPRAMQLAGHASPNRVFGTLADEVVARVAAGVSLTEAVNASPVFPEDARHILASGEHGNTLADSFEAVGRLYQARLLRELQVMVALVEPAAIVALGVLVAGFVYGVYRPIFMMSRTVTGA